MYKAITLNGDTDVYFNNELLYKCIVYKYLFEDKFYIENIHKEKLLELEIKHFFGFNKRYLIKKQKFQEKIELSKFKRKLSLKVGNDTILLNEKIRAWKFEGDFIVNNKVSGSFKNNLKFFESSFTFNFDKESGTNLYCMILFSILIIDKFNTRPTS